MIQAMFQMEECSRNDKELVSWNADLRGGRQQTKYQEESATQKIKLHVGMKSDRGEHLDWGFQGRPQMRRLQAKT